MSSMTYERRFIASYLPLSTICDLYFCNFIRHQIHRKSYVDVNDIIHAGVNDDGICPNYNKIKRRCLSNP